MESIKELSRRRVTHQVFRGDSEKESEGQADELATARAQSLTLEERYISEHGSAETYGMRMLMRSL
jgi:hypothetical protein